MATRQDVYGRFGATAEAAQWFEHELGDLLYTARALELGLDHTPNPGMASKLFAELERDTAGVLLGKVKKRFRVSPHGARSLTGALEARNMLIHGYFVHHRDNLGTEAGRANATAMLDSFDASLRAAREEVRWLTYGAIQMILDRRGRKASG